MNTCLKDDAKLIGKGKCCIMLIQKLKKRAFKITVFYLKSNNFVLFFYLLFSLHKYFFHKYNYIHFFILENFYHLFKN